MQIILIGGKARSGKSTIANFMVEELKKQGKKPCELQIGQYIKYYAMKYFNWDGKEETKPRSLLQELGTEVIRNKIDPDFHIDRLIQDIEVLSYFYDTFIVSDVRMPVEIEKPKTKFDNVVTLKMVRESDELNSKEQKHVTETALDSYDEIDYIVDNNKTLEDLRLKAKDILERIGD